MTPRRLLFVYSAAEFSTFDVARGYRDALARSGKFEIRDYRLYARLRYHARALGDPRAADLDLLTRVASENIVVEAMRHRADLVFIVSGLALHPDAIWYLRRAGIKAAVLFTESPYDDTEQLAFHAVYPEMTCFTMERTSATAGWRYLPAAYDPAVHRPVPDVVEQDDVLLVGTLWRERISVLERVDWMGIRPRFIGTWVAPPTPDESPIGQYYEEGCVANSQTPSLYASTRIALNLHRAHPAAESLNPRAYELAACGAFQLADSRAELNEVFGRNGSCAVATFTPETLGERIRHWLARPAERREMADAARRAVAPHTFDARVETLLKYLS